MRRSITGLIIAALGGLLLVWLIWSAGPQKIWDGLRQVGWGLVAVIAIAGLRFVARAAAWIRCLERPHRLRLGDAFTAVVSGDALGNATPLGPLVSEPAKVALVRTRVPLAAAFTALAIENVFYTLSVAAVIAAGTVALLLRGGLDQQLRLAAEIGILFILSMYLVAAWTLLRRPALLSRAIGVFGTRIHPSRLDKIRRLEQDIYTFASRRHRELGPVVALELAFHALGVLEVYVTLWLLLREPPSLVTSFILETANRLITVLFKFVPMQQPGLSEVGTVLVAEVLGLRRSTAGTLAIVRRARMLVWQLTGTMLLVRHGVTARRILDDEELRGSRLHSSTTGDV